MAEDKQGGGNPPFIAQTEEYNLQNDVGRHTRNTELQSRGFREQLHEPQPSPYVHATERMSAIDTDSAALRTLAHGVDAAVAIHEKYDEGPSIREYIDDVHEITKAHDNKLITDEQYRTQMRLARNNAQNAYSDNPKAMAKLKDFWGSKEYGEYNQYEAAQWAQAQAYTKLTGEACSPTDADFADKVLVVQKFAKMEQDRIISGSELQIANNKENLSALEFKPLVDKYFQDSSKQLSVAIDNIIKEGKLPTEGKLQGLSDAVMAAELDFRKNTSRHSEDPSVRSKLDIFSRVQQHFANAFKATEYSEMMRNLNLVQMELGIARGQEDLAYNRATHAQYYENLRNKANEGKTKPEAAMEATKASLGDSESAKNLTDRARRGEQGADYLQVSSAIHAYEKNPDLLQSILWTGNSGTWKDFGEEAAPYEKEMLLQNGSNVFEQVEKTLLKYGREPIFDPTTNEMSTLNRQVYFDSITPNGIVVRAKNGAADAAVKYAEALSRVFSNGLEMVACGNDKQCNWKSLAKDKAFLKQLQYRMSPYIGGKK